MKKPDDIRIYTTNTVKKGIKKWADQEDTSMSQIVHVILKEALQNRKSVTKNLSTS